MAVWAAATAFNTSATASLAWPRMRCVAKGSFSASQGQPPSPNKVKRTFSRTRCPEAVAGVATDALDLIIRAALPVALFGLGGVLYRYRPEGDRATIAYISAVSLIVHPVIVYTLGRFAHLDNASLRSAVLTAGVAPGVNAYLFANMYGVAKRVAASSVLIATALTTLSMWVWLSILP